LDFRLNVSAVEKFILILSLFSGIFSTVGLAEERTVSEDTATDLIELQIEELLNIERENGK